MFYKFLFLFFLAAFVSACSTTPKDTADASGSGSSGSSDAVTSEPSAGDASILEDLINTSLGQPTIEPGSQEDLIVNVGDRVFFAYNSAELDSGSHQILHEQAAWIKQNKVSLFLGCYNVFAFANQMCKKKF